MRTGFSQAALKQFSQNTKLQVKADITFANGTSTTIPPERLMMGETTFSESTSSTSGFDVGACIIGDMSTKLNNVDGYFDDWDFTSAKMTVSLGISYPNSAGTTTTSWVQWGVYNVVQPDTYGTIISLDCDDNLGLAGFSDDFSKVTALVAGRSYTATYIVSRIANYCGISAASTFPNSSTYLTIPSDDMTVIEALGYVAQATCNYVKCRPDGYIALGWYDKDFSANDSSILDGQMFGEDSGNTVDGGDFTFASADTIDGGDFTTAADSIMINAISNLSVGTDDVQITGVSVTAMDEVVTEDGKETTGEAGETYTFGTDDYQLVISDNPFIPYGKAEAYGKLIAAGCVGLKMRPFSVSALGDLRAQAGDAVCIWDANAIQYRSYITSLTFKVGGYEDFSNSAQVPTRQAAANASAKTDLWEKAKNLVRTEKTAREIAYADLAEKIANARGMFINKTDENNKHITDESTDAAIYWVTDVDWEDGTNDAPLFLNSSVLWKLTVDTISVSTGFTTSAKTERKWNFILDATGQAILYRIYTIGLDADYITTGQITAQKNAANNYWNLETGDFKVSDGTSSVELGNNQLTINVKKGVIQNADGSTYLNLTDNIFTTSNIVVNEGADLGTFKVVKSTVENKNCQTYLTSGPDLYGNTSGTPVHESGIEGRQCSAGTVIGQDAFIIADGKQRAQLDLTSTGVSTTGLSQTQKGGFLNLDDSYGNGIAIYADKPYIVNEYVTASGDNKITKGDTKIYNGAIISNTAVPLIFDPTNGNDITILDRTSEDIGWPILRRGLSTVPARWIDVANREYTGYGLVNGVNMAASDNTITLYDYVRPWGFYKGLCTGADSSQRRTRNTVTFGTTSVLTGVKSTGTANVLKGSYSNGTLTLSTTSVPTGYTASGTANAYTKVTVS